jgi:hypothetical protein
MITETALLPPALGAAKDGEKIQFQLLRLQLLLHTFGGGGLHFFFIGYRGQPITTSSGKWLQLLLTISDVVDLSRFRFDLTYRVVRSDSTLFSLPFSTSQSSSSSATPYGNSNGGVIGVAQHISGGGGGVDIGGSSSLQQVDNSIIVSYGDPVPGTLCSHNLHSCDQRTCIIQSPNFPGLYPR